MEDTGPNRGLCATIYDNKQQWLTHNFYKTSLLDLLVLVQQTSLADNLPKFVFTMTVVDLTLLGVPEYFPEPLENLEPELETLLLSTLLESSSVVHGLN